MSEWKETEYGKMPITWSLRKVNDIKGVDRRSMAMGPFGSNIKAENFVEKGVPVIRGTNMNYYKNVGGKFVYLTEEKADELIGSNCKAGDLVFTHRGTIGQVALIPSGKFDRYVISQSGMKLTVNPEIINNEFLFYFFKSEYGQHPILKNEAQVGVPSISNPLTSLKQIEVHVPSLLEQTAIASILSSLDDKIDLLHRQNKTLEQLAETLFRQWFVEEVEESWARSEIGKVLKTELGGTPSTIIPEYWDGNIPWINSGEINKFRIIEPTRCITQLGLEKSNTKLLPIGTTVIAITGATLGQISLLEIEACANQSVVGIIPTNEIPSEFVFLWVKHKLVGIIANETGGAQQHINKNDVNETEIIIPPKGLMKEKAPILKTYFDKITGNTKQICTLTQLRDTLLPKLMSGEVRVKV